jgi:cytochrome c1
MNFRIYAAVLAAFSSLIGVVACSTAKSQTEPPTVKAQVEHGRYLVVYYGCETCHDIPDIHGVRGSIGPSLKHFATKYYLAGELPKSPENLRRWIQHPHSINPQTLMPDMNVTDDDAADIALFLETLQ